MMVLNNLTSDDALMTSQRDFVLFFSSTARACKLTCRCDTDDENFSELSSHFFETCSQRHSLPRCCLPCSPAPNNQWRHN